MNFKENIQYFCPACEREVIEFPLHKGDEPIEYDCEVYHKACLQDMFEEAANMTEKENVD